MYHTKNIEKTIKIVIVDDEPFNVSLMNKMARKAIEKTYSIFNFDIKTTVNPLEALNIVINENTHLLITDIMMPEIDGFELIKRLREKFNMEELKIIIVTSLEDRESRIRALLAGANDYTTKPVDNIEFPVRIMNNIKLIENYLLLKDKTLILENAVEKAIHEIKVREKEVIFRLAAATEFKDQFTGYHIQRVAEYCKLIAEDYGCDKTFTDNIHTAAPLHDIGKIAIPEHILRKPEKLDPEEWDIMKKHTLFGYELLEDSDIPLLQLAARIALLHHEKWNGKGYPKGLSGKRIPLEARIAAIADVFDALTSVRPYKKAFSFEKAMEIMKSEREKSFDPTLLDIFISHEKQVKKIYNKLKGAEN